MVKSKNMKHSTCALYHNTWSCDMIDPPKSYAAAAATPMTTSNAFSSLNDDNDNVSTSSHYSTPYLDAYLDKKKPH